MTQTPSATTSVTVDNSRLSGMRGHPRGLATLFFTEMWERFSYYGMRALLELVMTAPLAQLHGGLGFDVPKSAAIYGLYTSLVYLLALPGGWIADTLWGQRKTVFVGGCIIACGHFSMAIPTEPTFYLGLLLIVLGTGLLKPNVSTMVADLYPEGGARRDAGFSIFYMGINSGALMGTILCGFIGEKYNYHLGFSLAGIGMVLGLVQYSFGGKHLGDAGRLKTADPPPVLARRSRNFYLATAGTAAAVVIFAFLVTSDVLRVTIQQVAFALGYLIVIIGALYFLYLFLAAGLTKPEKKRLGVLVWLFLLSAIFWSGYEQGGSSMNLFARDFTARSVLGWVMPASWLQNVNPLFIILFAPVFGFLWTWLAEHAKPILPRRRNSRWAFWPGRRLPRALLGSGLCHRHESRLHGVAGGHLLPAHRWRVVPLARGTFRHHQARSAGPRGGVDGRMVYFHRAGQPDRRPDRGAHAGAFAGGSVSRRLLVRRSRGIDRTAGKPTRKAFQRRGRLNSLSLPFVCHRWSCQFWNALTN